MKNTKTSSRPIRAARLASPAEKHTVTTDLTPSQSGSPSKLVELDDLAHSMLSHVCRAGDACRHPGEDPRELVNAAVTFYLCDGKHHRHGEFDLSCGDEALERAKSARLALEQGGNRVGVSITFRGGAARAINLVASKTGKNVGEVLQLAVCNDVCAWLFDSDPDHEPEIAAMFGIGREDR